MNGNANDESRNLNECLMNASRITAINGVNDAKHEKKEIPNIEIIGGYLKTITSLLEIILGVILKILKVILYH